MLYSCRFLTHRPIQQPVSWEGILAALFLLHSEVSMDNSTSDSSQIASNSSTAGQPRSLGVSNSLIALLILLIHHMQENLPTSSIYERSVLFVYCRICKSTCFICARICVYVHVFLKKYLFMSESHTDEKFLFHVTVRLWQGCWSETML